MSLGEMKNKQTVCLPIAFHPKALILLLGMAGLLAFYLTEAFPC